MGDDQPRDPAEAEEAIRQITRQLNILRSGPTLGGPSDDAQVIAELEAELVALKSRAQGAR